MEEKELINYLERRISEDQKRNKEYEEEWGEILDAYYEGKLPPGAFTDFSMQSMQALYEPSKLILPTISASVDVAHSSIINILTQTYPMYIIKDVKEEIAEQAKQIEDCLNLWYSRMNARLSLSPIIIEFLLHGWAVAKLVRDIFSDIPYLVLVPREDWVAPEVPWTPDFVNKVEYVAHRFYLSKWELLIRKNKYQNAKELANKLKDNELAELWEIYMYDEDMNDYVYTVSFKHRLILKKEEYKYPRGFFVFPYIPRRHSWRGIGMGQQLKSLQEERDALHNLNINAIKLYINKIVAVEQMRGIDLGNIKAGTKFYIPAGAGEAIKVIDLVRDLHPVQLTAEENSWRYAQMRSMITDYRIGMEQKGVERPTARGVAMLLSESNKISNYVIDNIKDVLREIGYTVMIYAYLDKVAALLGKKEAKKIEQIKSLQKIKELLNIDININSAVLNKEVQRNNAIILMQIIGQYLQQVLPAVMQYVNPQTPPQIKEVARKIIKISDDILAKTIRTFDIDLESLQISDLIRENENEFGNTEGAKALGDLAQTLGEFRNILLQQAGQSQGLGGGMQITGED